MDSKNKTTELENQTNTAKLALIQRDLDKASRERDEMQAQIELEKAQATEQMNQMVAQKASPVGIAHAVGKRTWGEHK